MLARIHWNKFEHRWTAHTYKSCTRYDYILVIGDWITETKPNKAQNPKGFVKTTYEQLKFLTKKEADLWLKTNEHKQLFYDKQNISFNLKEGTDIIFTPKGAFAKNSN